MLEIFPRDIGLQSSPVVNTGGLFKGAWREVEDAEVEVEITTGMVKSRKPALAS